LKKFIYKLYNSNNDLLYVGCTSNIEARINHHKSNQKWGEGIAVVRYRETIGNPIIDEAEVIKSCYPLYNIQHSNRDTLNEVDTTLFIEWKAKKGVTDTAIARRFKMPIRTLANWKKEKPSNWRRKLYIFMKEKLEREDHEEKREEHF